MPGSGIVASSIELPRLDQNIWGPTKGPRITPYEKPRFKQAKGLAESLGQTPLDLRNFPSANE